MSFNFSALFQNCTDSFASSHPSWVLDKAVYKTMIDDARVFDNLSEIVEPETTSTWINPEDGSFIIELGSVILSFCVDEVPGLFAALRHMKSVRIHRDEIMLDGEMTPIAICSFVYPTLFQEG